MSTLTQKDTSNSPKMGGFFTEEVLGSFDVQGLG